MKQNNVMQNDCNVKVISKHDQNIQSDTSLLCIFQLAVDEYETGWVKDADRLFEDLHKTIKMKANKL